MQSHLSLFGNNNNKNLQFQLNMRDYNCLSNCRKIHLFLHVRVTAEVANNSTNPKLLNHHLLFFVPNLTLASSDRSGSFLKDEFLDSGEFLEVVSIALNIWFCLFCSVLELFCMVTAVPIGADMLT